SRMQPQPRPQRLGICRALSQFREQPQLDRAQQRLGGPEAEPQLKDLLWRHFVLCRHVGSPVEDGGARRESISAMLAITWSACGAKVSRGLAPVSTPMVRPAPAARAMSRSCRLSPTTAMAAAGNPTTRPNASTIPGPGLAPWPLS